VLAEWESVRQFNIVGEEKAGVGRENLVRGDRSKPGGEKDRMKKDKSLGERVKKTGHGGEH